MGAALLARDELSAPEYAALAIWIVERLRGGGAPVSKSALRRLKLTRERFPIEACGLLKRRGEVYPNISLELSLKTYGPYDSAVTWLHQYTLAQPYPDPPPGAVHWLEPADQLLSNARFRLSRVNRMASRVEGWLSARKDRLPTVLALAGTIVVLLLTAALSFLVGRLSKP